MFLKKDPALPPEHELVVTKTLGCALTVHRVLGPGFREPIYERALCLELDDQGLRFECEKPIG
jgi:GxxExxY protein